MKKLLFLMLVASIAHVGCSDKPPHDGGTDSSSSDSNSSINNNNTSNNNHKSEGKELTPEEKEQQKQLKECEAKRRKGEAIDASCYCAASKNSAQCLCRTKPELANRNECKCILHPELHECACDVDASSAACECLKNPTQPGCEKESDFNLCQSFCAQSTENQKWIMGESTVTTFKPDQQKEWQEKRDRLNDLDCDHDGWTNATEVQKKTKLCNEDTDGDGVIDSQDGNNNTSCTLTGNCNSDDADNDGVPDQREHELGLDPNNPKTPFTGPFDHSPLGKPAIVDRYGQTDHDLWIIDACKNYLSQQASFKPNTLQTSQLDSDGRKPDEDKADIKMYLPTDTEGVVLPVKSSAQKGPREAAMLFAASGQSVYGGLISKGIKRKDGTQRALNLLNEAISNGSFKTNTNERLESQTVSGDETQTHDHFEFSTGTFTIGSGHTINAVQKNLLGLAGKSIADKFDTTSYSAAGSSLNSQHGYLLKLTVIYRKSSSYDEANPSTWDQAIYVYSFSPRVNLGYIPGTTEKLLDVGTELAKTRMTDLTNTTAITQVVNEVEPVCVEMRTDVPTIPVYFYFILDESGSMRSRNQALSSISAAFFSKIKRSQLDGEFKAGITNIAMKSESKPGWKTRDTGVVQGWETEAEPFQQTVNLITRMGGDQEEGFTVAKQGIPKMRALPNTDPLRIPENSKLFTIWVTDEPDAVWFPIWKHSSSSGEAELTKIANDFKNNYRSTAFAFVTNPTDVNGITDSNKTPGEGSGYCYATVATATGGDYAELTQSTSASSYFLTLDLMLQKAAASTSTSRLPRTPISSTLQIVRDWSQTKPSKKVVGQYVPRSTVNGFAYVSSNNAIMFTGDFRPFRNIDASTGRKTRGQDFIVLYQFYKYKTKVFL